ncbi:MAG: DUF5333 domain-containing protein [Pseudomonadota bacterium]
MTSALCAFAIIFAFAAGTVVAQARPALRDVPQIDNGLFTIGLADRIRKTCPEISARMLVALGELSSLQRLARDMGYTRDEVETHLDSEAEKDRLRARASAYFEDRGLNEDVAGHCALGRSEIAQNSAVGRLLRLDN